MVKKFKLDATTFIEPLPDDCDLIIKVNSMKEITVRVNESRVFHVLAALDMILATVNSRGKGLIQQYLLNQAGRELELSIALRKQKEQGLMGDAEKDTSGRRKR